MGLIISDSVPIVLKEGSETDSFANQTFRSERIKRSSSRGSLPFPNEFSWKSLFHLNDFQQKFSKFWLTVKHPLHVSYLYSFSHLP